MRRALWLAPLVIACSVRTGCESASVRRQVDGLSVEVSAHGVKSYGLGAAGIPHVGGIFWPQFEGYGIELRLHVDDRPPVAVVMPAPDPDVAPPEEALQAAVQSVELSAAPTGEHMAFRKVAGGGWTVVHMLPQGVPFRSRHSDGMADASPLDWTAFPPPESIALEALTKPRPEPSVLEAVRAQSAAEPWDSALLDVWEPGGAIHDVLVARLEARDAIDGAFVEKAAQEALSHVSSGGKTVRPAVDLLLALGDENWVAEMDEQLLQALPDRHATAVLKRRTAPVRTIGRKFPPRNDLKSRARAALENLK